MKATLYDLHCECGWQMYCHHYPVRLLQCLNPECGYQGRQFYPPMFELSEVEVDSKI